MRSAVMGDGMKRVLPVVDEGGIIEQGTHDDLMKQDGMYRSLYQLQFRDRDEAV